MKKIIALLLVLTLSLTLYVPCAYAEETETAEIATISEIADTENVAEVEETEAVSGEVETVETTDIAEETSETVTEKEEPAAFSVTMAINEKILIANGVQREITPPVLVRGKTYVDLYAVAYSLGYGVQWVESKVGYFKVTTPSASVDFTVISHWDDLFNQKYKFFTKDSKIYVALRELADLMGYTIAYDKGLISVGEKVDIPGDIYGAIDTTGLDSYIYKTYPYWAQYVVNPYQKYSYETMMKNAKQLEQMYPDIIKTSSIGKSVEGRDLLLMEFGRGPVKIFVCGTHHAREYIATTYLMYAVDRYAYAYKNNSSWNGYNTKEILDKVTFCMVPMVNPDGVNLVQNGVGATKNPDAIKNMKVYEGAKYGYSAWKANINGVDVNWNYDKDWYEDKNKNPRGSNGFNGHKPASEPETIAVSNYVDSYYFEAYLSFHTQGEIFYWADNPDKSTGIYQAIKNTTGFTGYMEVPTGKGGSFFDYVYRKYKKPTVTVELCPYIGNYPYPDKSFDTVWRPTKNVLLVVGNLYKNAVR